MAPKYTKGQKVTIVLVKDQHMHVKYQEFEPYVSKSGTILECYSVPLKELPRGEGLGLPRENYIYKVRIENEVEAIPEECLEPCVD